MNESRIAVDVGTSGCRAARYSPAGAVLDTRAETYRPRSDSPFFELDPEEIYRAVLRCIFACLAEEATGAAEDHRVEIVFGSFLHSLVLVNRAGDPLTPLSTWADPRGGETLDLVRERYARSGWYRRTGCPLSPVYPLYRLLWYREHRPALYAEFSRALSIKAFILFRLAGRFVEDVSIASGSGLFELERRDWDPEVLDFLGLDKKRLGRVAGAETILNCPAPELPGETTIIAGSSDGPLAHLGDAGGDPAVFSLTMGTSGAVRRSVNVFRPSGDLNQWCYVLAGDRLVQGLATGNAGNVLEWFLKAENILPGRFDFEGIDETLARTPVSPGLFFIPFVFPERDPALNSIEAGFVGREADHGFGDFLRAILEAVVFNVVRLCDSLREGAGAGEGTGEEATREPAGRVVLSGSLTRLRFVQVTLAALIDVPVHTGPEAGASLRGAIRLRRSMEGSAKGPDAESTAMPETTRVASPSVTGEAEALRRKYDDWRALILDRLSRAKTN